jgi:hypothetical protein
MNDGISLTSTAHPIPKTIWARIYWWFRCLRGIRSSNIETIEIEIKDQEWRPLKIKSMDHKL